MLYCRRTRSEPKPSHVGCPRRKRQSWHTPCLGRDCCAAGRAGRWRTFPGIVPDAEAFAEQLVDALLDGEAIESHDARAAAELYGDFADAFVGNRWSDRRLARVGRGAVLRAAALA